MRIFGGILLAVLLAAGAFAIYSFQSYHLGTVRQDATVVIAPGTHVRGMLKQLHEQQVLPAPWVIALPVFARQQYRTFKAGEYEFGAGMSPLDVLTKIARGEVVIHKLTIPEGFTSAQVGAVLTAEPLLSGAAPAIAEGSVFPNTYQFLRGEDRAAFTAKMTRAMAELLGKEWTARAADLPLKTPAEALVLASIIEKETSVPTERPLVAAVYLNRLKKGMKLQADPTVAYGVDPSGLSKRPLSESDLARDTPYNTYVRDGLPPTPICNPGVAAIDAALHPAASDALYFVATGTGGHHFAATLAEHQKNVEHYRQATHPRPVPNPATALPKAKPLKMKRRPNQQEE